MNTLLFKALEARYHAQKLDALARLSVYGTNSVGIGEHPQITDEMDTLVQQFVDANDKLESIKKILNELETEKS